MHRDRACSARRTLLMTGLTFLLVSADGPAHAHDSSGNPRPYKLPPSLLGYFKARYVNVDDSLIASLQETPDGPRGDIFVSGKFRPTVDVEGKTPEERARRIARAFVDQEATLLDTPDPAEIREMPLTWRDDGTALVHYVRYVGEVQLSEWFLRVEVGADGAITRVHATLSPVSSDLYAALKREAGEPGAGDHGAEPGRDLAAPLRHLGRERIHRIEARLGVQYRRLHGRNSQQELQRDFRTQYAWCDSL